MNFLLLLVGAGLYIPMAPRSETAIFCAQTNALVYVVYLNSRKKQDATAHLKVAYHLNAGDADATYKRYSGSVGMMAPNIYFHERMPTEGELRAWSDLRAQRGQPRVVPFEKTTKRQLRCAVDVKATNKTARRKELFNQTKPAGRVGGATNPLLHASEATDAKSDVVVLVADITGDPGWKISNAMAAWKAIMIDAVDAAEEA